MATNSFNCSPILLIGFNRPDYMAAQVAAIRPACPDKLYLAVDGPRADRHGEAELCRQVRECAALVDWPCEVKTLFRERNLDCLSGKPPHGFHAGGFSAYAARFMNKP